MASLAKRTASRFSEQSLSEEGRRRGSSRSFSSLSFRSQVIDDVEDDVETSQGKRSCRRRLSFDDRNASGCSTTSSAGLHPLNKDRRSARSIHSSANARWQSSPCRSWREVLQSLAELWIEQQVASCGGDGKDWIEVVSEKLSSTEEQLDILELDGIELLDHDQELALALFQILMPLLQSSWIIFFACFPLPSFGAERAGTAVHTLLMPKLNVALACGSASHLCLCPFSPFMSCNTDSAYLHEQW
ncbi:hypothetical protein L7F22_036408 [Adiantum nelumboides]|nr:hypothetical protein [Adiantum nelumboides]